MIERLLLLVDDSPSCRAAANWTLDLAQRLSARVLALYVVDSALPGKGKARDERLAALEEKAWKALYEIEDDAFEKDVKISLLLDQGESLSTLLNICRSYNVQLVVLSSEARLRPQDLIAHSSSPVLFFNERRK